MTFKFSPILLLFTVLIFCNSCTTTKSFDTVESKVVIKSETTKKPKNIILLIGDGMGLSEVSASLFYNEDPSNFERFSTVGLIKTSASSDLITDSAASATAFSAGIKTYNGAIGVDNNTIAVETIVEHLSKKGFSTGLIATSSIVHATPASFYAHVKKRNQYEDIATFLPQSNVDFFAGGGLKFFNKRKDGRDLLSELEANGYLVNISGLTSEVNSSATTSDQKKMAFLLAEDGMPKMSEGRADFLAEATAMALETLSKNSNGFFLMIEGSQIDWGGHNNDANYLISELLDFDKTIGVALDYAEKDGNTLVIVTADHETGGFTLATDNGNYNKIKPSFSTGGHSATMVPVFTKGPGEMLFTGIYENTEIFHKMKLLLTK